MTGLTITETPFNDWDDGGLSSEAIANSKSLDTAPTTPFVKADVLVVVWQGEMGDEWDGTSAAVIMLRDGRFVAWESIYTPTGSGFHHDYYDEPTPLVFSYNLRLLVNAALSDQARRMIGVPHELWNEAVASAWPSDPEPPAKAHG